MDSCSFLGSVKPLTNGWNNFSIEELTNYLAELASVGITEEDVPETFSVINGVKSFVDAIAPALNGDAEPEYVLGGFAVKGVLEKVSGPVFLRVEDEVKLKVGKDTFYDVEFSNGQVKVGNLQGTAKLYQVKKSDGTISTTKDGKPWYKGEASLLDMEDDDDMIYEIPFSVSVEPVDGDGKPIPINEAKLIKSVSNGSLYKYLNYPSSGGGNVYVDMRWLPEGEYRVLGISEKREKDFGDGIVESWNLEIEDVGIVESRYGIKTMLKNEEAIYRKLAERPEGLTMAVTKHLVTYKTLDGVLHEKEPFNNFYLAACSKQVKDFNANKMSGDGTRHDVSVGFLKFKDYTGNDWGIKLINGGREKLELPTVHSAGSLPAASEPAALEAKAEVVSEYDEVEF